MDGSPLLSPKFIRMNSASAVWGLKRFAERARRISEMLCFPARALSLSLPPWRVPNTCCFTASQSPKHSHNSLPLASRNRKYASWSCVRKVKATCRKKGQIVRKPTFTSSVRNTTFSPEFYSFGEVPPRTKFDALSSCMDFFIGPAFSESAVGAKGTVSALTQREGERGMDGDILSD